jgi:hypothetical protein
MVYQIEREVQGLRDLTVTSELYQKQADFSRTARTGKMLFPMYCTLNISIEIEFYSSYPSAVSVKLSILMPY